MKILSLVLLVNGNSLWDLCYFGSGARDTYKTKEEATQTLEADGFKFLWLYGSKFESLEQSEVWGYTVED